ncbi:hypothetical protein BLA14095_00741 [Burkholderia lata]|uniref:hypothetical protein n=1 Tax=Burkholderia lata (strain ATCC 17760 / DSM 23089 / LMG 22485 / NCIMB 9086 / R18194 / 383) TaxID=482957 RepID=UPI0014534499|nr:hypothetical protein [Burkholderia lata]VWB21902.1 hypothetical protein BLA14095_00741 [Burkholderia lata]
MNLSSFVKCFKLSALLASVIAICPCAASAGTARFVSSFSTVTASDSQNLQNTYMSEMDGSNSAYNKLNGVHVTPEQFVSVRGRDSMYQTKAIISVWSRLIGNGGAPVSDLDGAINTLGQQVIDGYRDKILALYIYDEPTVANVSKNSLELIISKLNARFSGIPTYVVYNSNCYVNSSCSSSLSMSERDIPGNVDWVGFDVYNWNNDPSFVTNTISPYLTQLRSHLDQLGMKKAIVIVAQGFQPGSSTPSASSDNTLAQQMKNYFSLLESANSCTQSCGLQRVIGIDSYFWGVDANAQGSHWLPNTQRAMFDVAGPIINASVSGNNYYTPEPNFNGQFAVITNGMPRYYYKYVSNLYYCAYASEQEYLNDKSALGLANVITPIYPTIETLFNNGPCHP